MINENIAQGKWSQIKGEIRKAWGKLTEDELEQTKGDVSRISGLVQQKYGETQESVRERLNRFISEAKPNEPEKNQKLT